MRRGSRRYLIVGFALTLAMVLLKGLDPYPLRLAELKFYDWRFSVVRGPLKPTGRVFIGAIDEKSIDELGRWPWPRDVQADLLKALKDYGAVTIGYDVVFSEPDDSGGLTALKEIQSKLGKESDASDKAVSSMLQWAVKKADRDRIFSEALKSSQGVVMGYFFHTSPAGLSHLSSETQEEGYQLIRRSKYPIVRKRSGGSDAVVRRAFAAETSYAPLARAAHLAGHFNVIPDEDGTLRWVPLVLKYRDHYFPPLVLQMLRQYLKAAGMSSSLILDMDDSGVVQVTLGPMKIPVDERGWMLINYLGPHNTLPYVSATDVYHHRLPEGALEGSLVILGATAAGIYDLRVTPFDSNMPGPEIHGMILENILQNTFVIRPHWVVAIDFAAVLLFGLLISVVAAWSRAFWSGLMGFAVVVVALAVDYHLFINKGIWINVTSPLLTVSVVFVGITLIKYLTEEKEKRFYRSAFGQYLSPKVIERIVENPDLLSLGGERKVLTASFSDLEGFTRISEKMSPEQLVEFLNQYLTDMTEIILGYDGTVDKFEGDAIISFYGAPLPLDDHPRRACLAAIAMQQHLAELRPQLVAQGLPELKMRVGIHTGPMVVGNMGSQKKMDYTIIGDSVNLTARLEGVNKFYKTGTLISEATWKAAGDGLAGREVDMVQVVGREEPIRIFELVGLKEKMEETWEEIVARYAEGLAAYRDQRWSEAEAAFERVLALKPNDGPSLTLLERCKMYRQAPPKIDWAGVFVLEEK